MSLIKTSILIFLSLGLVIFSLMVSEPKLTMPGPDDNITTPPDKPPVATGEIETFQHSVKIPVHAPVVETSASPIVPETAITRLPELYPELHQIIALENLPPSEALVTLQQFLHNADPVIRLAALEAIGDMADNDIALQLIELLQDAVPQIRIAALEALAESPQTTWISSIEPIVFDVDLEVRISAIEALASLEDTDAVYTLAGLLGDPDSQIRGHAVNALGEIGGELATSFLQQARFDGDPKIRKNARAILQEIASVANNSKL